MDEQNIDLHGILKVFRRRFRFILGFIGMALVLAVVSLILIPPKYTATAKLLLDVVNKNLFDPAEPTPSTTLANALIETEVELLRSNAVLLQTFSELNMINSNEFGPPNATIEEGSSVASSEQFERFRQSIKIGRQGATYIINVSVSAKSPLTAAEIANSLARSHISMKNDTRNRLSAAAQHLFEDRIVAVSALKELAHQELENFIPANLNEVIELNRDVQIPLLRDQILKLTMLHQNNADVLSALNVEPSQIQLEMQNSTLISEGLSSLLQQRHELVARLLDTQNDPTSLAKEKIKLGQLDNAMRSEIDSELIRFRKQQEGVVEQLSAARNELAKRVIQIAPTSLVSKLDALRVRAKVNDELYQRLVERGSELQAQTGVQVSNVNIAELAIAPSMPSFPNKLLTLLLSFIVATASAIGLAFILDQYWGGVKSEEQLADIVSRRVGSVVPSFQLPKDLYKVPMNLVEVMEVAPASNFVESIRRIRSEIELSNLSSPDISAGSGAQTILVTSARQGEGKSTIAITLAKSFAKAGARVLLLDADFRKPSVHNFLNIGGGPGLVEYLQNPLSIDGLATSLVKQVIPNLDVFVGQNHLGVSSDQLVSGDGLRRLIESAKKRYDYVVIDTPPLLPFVDTSYLLGYANVAVFVVGFQTTSQQDVRKADALLDKYLAPTTLVVPVLNRSDPIATAYGAEYAV